MFDELLPDRLAGMWAKVEGGEIAREKFFKIQEELIDTHRARWKDALLLEGVAELEASIIEELCAYTGNPDAQATRELCEQALARIRGEWHEQVATVDRDSVEKFYDQSRAMLYELMWWHTLVDDISPLSYVTALEFACLHRCSSFLDFGCGVGSGGILFAKNGFAVTLADISSNMLQVSGWRFAKRNLEARFLDLKTEKLPHARFDFITAMDVFEHLLDPVATVRDLDAALKPGGYIFGRFHAEIDEERPHHIVFDFGPTLDELERCGFERVWRDEWLWGHEVYQKKL